MQIEGEPETNVFKDDWEKVADRILIAIMWGTVFGVGGYALLLNAGIIG